MTADTELPIIIKSISRTKGYKMISNSSYNKEVLYVLIEILYSIYHLSI